MAKKMTVLSDGAWGTALAMVLCDNNHDVTMWGPFADYLDEMRQSRKNSRFLASVDLPENLQFEADIAKAIDGAEIIVLATPSQFMRGTLEKLAPCLKKEQILVNVAKGIECGTLKRVSQLCEELLGEHTFTALAGPSHAEEVALKRATAVVVAAKELKTAEVVQHAFINDYFRVYTADDIVGVELGGAVKNVIAVAAGMVDGMGGSDNTKAALITRGIAEMGRLGEALNGKKETFSGLSGIGDLIVTCTSGHSRNRHVGEALGRGKKLSEVLEEMGMVVAEGVKTAESTYALAKQVNVDIPIINEVYAVLYQDKSPHDAVADLMNRKARPEQD